MPRLTPHDLRHTAASLAVQAGANVKAVQRMLGHKSAAMTLDVYADLFDDELDAVAKAMDAAASITKSARPKTRDGHFTLAVAVGFELEKPPSVTCGNAQKHCNSGEFGSR